MPGTTAGVYTGALTAGTEVSSTYEGRHLTVRDDELIHPVAADTFVNKGDPVIVCDAGAPGTYGRIVGVAFADGTAAADWIAIDTEGIFNLPIYADDDAGGSDIEIGDPLFIRAGHLTGVATLDGLGDAEISKRRNLDTQVFFGYALGSLTSGGAGVIAIKVHAAPEEQQDEYVSWLDGHAVDIGKSFNITDATALAAGTNRGVYVSYTCATAMAGAIDVMGVDAFVTGDCAAVNCIAMYTGGCGTATLGELSGLNVYMDDIGAGATVAQKFCINLNNDNGDNATVAGFIRVYSHAAGLDSVIYLGNNGGNMITNLLQFSAAVEPYSAGTLTDSAAGDILCDSRIRILVGASPYYIPLYNTAP